MEIWDAYDDKCKKMDGMVLERGTPIPAGIYHMVCDIAVKHTDGTFLLMQRDRSKHLGGMWELTAGGSALLGETADECARRELQEETGIAASNLEQLGSLVHNGHHSIYFEYLCLTDCRKDSIVLCPGETINYKWLSVDELKAMDPDHLATTRIQNFIHELM